MIRPQQLLIVSCMPGTNCCRRACCLQEFYFYCPPSLRGERGQLSRRIGAGKRVLPEAECLTPASKRAKLNFLATTKDVSRWLALPEDLVRPGCRQ